MRNTFYPAALITMFMAGLSAAFGLIGIIERNNFWLSIPFILCACLATLFMYIDEKELGAR